MNIQQLKSSIAEFPDFPQKGINFKDISPLLQNPKLFSFAVDEMAKKIGKIPCTKFIGIEARGFIFASALAYKLKKGLIICRKPGKLPGKLLSHSYSYEYSSSEISIQKNSLEPHDKIIIVDDVLATGNTALAAYKLSSANAQVSGMVFLIDLTFLNGKKYIRENSQLKDEQVVSLIQY